MVVHIPSDSSACRPMKNCSFEVSALRESYMEESTSRLQPGPKVTMLLSAMALWQGVATQSCPEYQKLEAREKEVNKGGTEIRDKRVSF